MSHELNEVIGQEQGKGNEMEADQGFFQTFMVADQAAETSKPGKARVPFGRDNLASGQQHEPAFGIGQFD